MALMISTNKKYDKHNTQWSTHRRVWTKRANDNFAYIVHCFQSGCIDICAALLAKSSICNSHGAFSVSNQKYLQILNGNSFAVDGTFFLAHLSFHSYLRIEAVVNRISLSLSASVRCIFRMVGNQTLSTCASCAHSCIPCCMCSLLYWGFCLHTSL